MEPLKVGDVCWLVESYGEEPKQAKVLKVTPTGQIKIDLLPFVDMKFKPNAYFTYIEMGGDSMVFPDCRKGEIFDTYNNLQEGKRIERQCRERERIEREERYLNELTETAAVLSTVEKTTIVLSDSVKIVTLVIPSNRVGKIVFVVVKITRVKTDSFQNKPFEVDVTYTYSREGSFPSCSCMYADTEDEAVLIGAHAAYF